MSWAQCQWMSSFHAWAQMATMAFPFLLLKWNLESEDWWVPRFFVWLKLHFASRVWFYIKGGRRRRRRKLGSVVTATPDRAGTWKTFMQICSRALYTRHGRNEKIACGSLKASLTLVSSRVSALPLRARRDSCVNKTLVDSVSDERTVVFYQDWIRKCL